MFVCVSLLVAENIWRTELDFMVTHRDRLVILSFMASPYQNTSNSGGGAGGEDDQNDTKVDRTAYIENNDLSHTHLIEKFHAGNFDENDYFDTHEKLEAETVPPAATIATTALTSTSTIKSSMSKPNSILSSSATSQNAAAEMDGTRKNSNGRMKNRNNSNGGGRRGEKANRKNADGTNKKADVGVGDEFGGDERTTIFSGITKLPKKSGNSKEARIVDIVDEVANGGGVTQRKTMPTKDSNIHIVKTVADGIVPSTPISTDSKIIEIKPSTVGRYAKKQKRSIEAIPFRTDETLLSGEDDDDDLNDGNDDSIDNDAPPPPRIYVNVESDNIAGTQTENADPFFRTFRLVDDVHVEGAEAAALIGSAVPINATAAAPVHLNGIAAYLNKYLNVNKAIGTFVCCMPNAAAQWPQEQKWIHVSFLSLSLSLCLFVSRFGFCSFCYHRCENLVESAEFWIFKFRDCRDCLVGTISERVLGHIETVRHGFQHSNDCQWNWYSAGLRWHFGHL